MGSVGGVGGTMSQLFGGFLVVRVVVLVSVLVLGGLFFVLRPDRPEAASEGRSFDVEIRDDGMEPEEVSVREGDRVTMSFTADHQVEIHLHGYDVERSAGPGGSSELFVEARLTGRFPIEDHETGDELGVLVVEPR